MKSDKKKTLIETDFPFLGTSWMMGGQEEEYWEDEMELMDKVANRTYLVVVVYDISDDKQRYQVSKVLLSYGERVQRSAFECHLTQRQYEELISRIVPMIDQSHDLLRIYKLAGNTQVNTWGSIPETFDEGLIII